MTLFHHTTDDLQVAGVALFSKLRKEKSFKSFER